MKLKEAIKQILGETPIEYSEYLSGDASVKSAYMKQDATAPIKLAKVLLPRIRDAGLEESYKIEIENIAPTIEMNTRGIKINVTSIVDRLKSNLSRAGELHTEIDPNGKLNLNSPVQLRRFIYGVLGLPIMPVDGAVTTDKKTLQRIYIRTNHPTIKKLLEYKELIAEVKFLKTLQQFIDKDTRCIYPYINGLGTETGRSSSSMPNLQNIKRDAFSRGLFVSREMRRLLCFDQCQIEPLILAALVGPGRFRELFAGDSADCYIAISRLLSQNLGIEIDRATAKILLLAVMYGMGPFAVADHLGVEKSKGQEIIDAFFSLFPEIRVLESVLYQFARKHGYVKTILGRRRYIANINSDDRKLAARARRKVLNSAIQGTAAELFKRQVRHLRNSLPMDCYLLLVVHDEILMECPEEKVSEYFEIAKKALEESPSWFPLPLKVKGGVGNTWAEAKP